MYPNQNNPQRPNAPYGSGYPPQQPAYNMSGAPQQPPYGGAMPYGNAPGSSNTYQPNMAAPYGGNQGMFGGIGNPQGGNPYGQGFQSQAGNPYAQGSQGPPGNPYGQGSQAQAGNPYGQGGFGMPGGYPPPSGQQPYGNNPYAQGPGGFGGGYPPQTGGYPPPGGSYAPTPGAPYAQSQGGYPGPNPGMNQNPGGFMSMDQRNQRLNQVIQKYEINQQFASRLQALANCEIVVLCDDSGSMNATLQGSNQTRWDELKKIVNIVVDIASTMDANGVDVFFLNRDSVPNVTNIQNMMHVFNSPPNGLTPLVPALRRIFAAKRGLSYEKKLLILVATDGAPTNDHGQPDINALEAVLRNERTPQTYITFLACTDDLEAVSYLSRWDKMLPNLDVIDDYNSERQEILRTRGFNFPFSFGDYIVKALLGSLDPWFDSLDDRA